MCRYEESNYLLYACFYSFGMFTVLNKNNISSNNSSVETVSQTEKQTEVVNDSFALKAPPAIPNDTFLTLSPSLT